MSINAPIRPAAGLAAALALCLVGAQPTPAAVSPHRAAGIAHSGAAGVAHGSAAGKRCPRRRPHRSGRAAGRCENAAPGKAGAAHRRAGSVRGRTHASLHGGGPSGGASGRGAGKSRAAGNTSAPAYGQAEISLVPGAPGTGQNGGPPGSPGFGSGDQRGENLLGETGETVSDPIDPRFLTETPFGTSSFWIQPWRAYLDTWSSTRLLDALGINFNVGPAKAEATAQLLHDSGFTLARREIDWGSMAYGEPGKFRNETTIRTVLDALHNHGLRPLILLNANSGDPGPSLHVTLETTAAAPAGAQTVTLAPASAAQVVPGKTGFNGLSFGGDPDVLITGVGTDGVATLSKPLPAALPAGAHAGTTLQYAPFGPPALPDGKPNPAFQETLAGWLSYVGAVCRMASSIFGPEGYDLEVWNELSFGSQFLDYEHYYSPGAEIPGPAGQDESEASSETQDSEPEYGAGSEEGEAETAKAHVLRDVTQALLAATVDYVRNPANGLGPGVGVSDGFASQTPFPSGAGAPVGLTALSKHPYVSQQVYPGAYNFRNIIPLNAFGERDIERGSETPLFIPTYESLFPEVTLTATHTETLIRDLAPFTTNVYGTPHGRDVGPAGGSPLQKWVTEYNLGIGRAPVMGPDESTPASGPAATLTPADKAHFHAKVALRSLVADVSKGMEREYFYAAAPGALSLIGENFFSALESSPNSYPGDAAGGETMMGLRNMLARFQGPGPSGAPRQLQLTSISQNGNHAQFAGDGTPAHPPLYDRDVLAVFPFQTSPTSYAIPVYVMTRNLLTLYQPGAPQSDVGRFDLPDETFHITLANLPPTATPPAIAAYDPLRNTATPATLTSWNDGTATIEIAATDYPRILTIDFTGA